MDHSLLGWMDGCLFQGFQHEKTTYEPVKEKKIFNIAEFIIFVEQNKKKRKNNK